MKPKRFTPHMMHGHHTLTNTFRNVSCITSHTTSGGIPKVAFWMQKHWMNTWRLPKDITYTGGGKLCWFDGIIFQMLIPILCKLKLKKYYNFDVCMWQLPGMTYACFHQMRRKCTAVGTSTRVGFTEAVLALARTNKYSKARITPLFSVAGPKASQLYDKMTVAKWKKWSAPQYLKQAGRKRSTAAAPDKPINKVVLSCQAASRMDLLSMLLKSRLWRSVGIRCVQELQSLHLFQWNVREIPPSLSKTGGGDWN